MTLNCWPSASISQVWNYSCVPPRPRNFPMCVKACGGQLTHNSSHHPSFSATDFSSLTCSGRENSRGASFAFLSCHGYAVQWAGIVEVNLTFLQYTLAFFSLPKIKLMLERFFDKMQIPLKTAVGNLSLKLNTYVNKMICNTPGTSQSGNAEGRRSQTGWKLRLLACDFANWYLHIQGFSPMLSATLSFCSDTHTTELNLQQTL